jgi:hypothetical protein
MKSIGETHVLLNCCIVAQGIIHILLRSQELAQLIYPVYPFIKASRILLCLSQCLL